MAIKKNNEGALESIPSYYAEKKKQRIKQKKEKSRELFRVFVKANKFYRKNYPESSQEPLIKWKKEKQKLTLDQDEAEVFTEELKELPTNIKLLMRDILHYSIEEHNYKKVDTYYKYKELRGIIRNLIPGGNILEKIEKIEKEKRKRENRLKRLREEYIKATESETHHKKHICSKCGKEFGNAGGLGSHMRTCDGEG